MNDGVFWRPARSDQRCPINGLAKMKPNTGVQRGHLSPFIYFFYQIVPANICLCPPHSLPPVTDGGKCSANGDTITPEPVKAEGENARRRRKKQQRDIFSPHAISTVEGWRGGETK